MMHTTELFDLRHSIAGVYLARFLYPWQALPGLRALILELGAELGEAYTEAAPNVWVHQTAVVAPTAHLAGPCILGAYTQVRHDAFIRGSVLVGVNCVVGNSVELKNAILFDQVQVPHYNYVGDSILGYKAHLGAGSVTSNVRSDRSPVTVKTAGKILETGLKKCGALVGDFVEVGCNAVLNPGTVVGKHSRIYPLSSVRGVVPENSIWKTGGVVVGKEQR